MINSGAKYDLEGAPRKVVDESVGPIAVGCGAAVPLKEVEEEVAFKFLANPSSLSCEEAFKLLRSVKGVFVGYEDKLSGLSECWRLFKLAGKLTSNLDLSCSWCSCIGLTDKSLEKRVAVERIPIPELALSGNVVIGLSVLGFSCRRVEFQEIPLVKFEKPKPPPSLIDVVAQAVDSGAGDVVVNVEGVIEDLAKEVKKGLEEELAALSSAVKEAVEGGAAYVEVEGLVDDVFNRLCKRLGRYALSLKEEARRKLMI